MTFYTLKLLPSAFAVVLAAALSATPSTPASAKKIDCARLWALLDQTEQQHISLLQRYDLSAVEKRKMDRLYRSQAGLRAVYDANCHPEAQAEQIIGGLIGGAILYGGGSFPGARGRTHGGGHSSGGGRHPWR